jgi:hypothetical protein
MPRICDLPESAIKVGMRITGLKTGIVGTIVKIDHQDDDYAWVQWDGETQAYGGFYGNDCIAEIIGEPT